jgi:serine/threonine protein phosphatase PrpC
MPLTEALQEPIAKWLLRKSQSYSVRAVLPEICVIGSARGRIRPENQDKAVIATFTSSIPERNFRICIVCDGLGGMVAGDQCAALAIDHFVTHLTTSVGYGDRSTRLRQALEHTNRRIVDRFQERGGTTLAAVLYSDSGVTAVSVGDSRLYRHVPGEDLEQLTVDDTLAARIAGLAPNQVAEIAAGPFANHLAQYVGQKSSLIPQVLDSRALFGTGKQSDGFSGVLLTTDGAHRLPRDVIRQVGKSALSARELVTRLLSIADWTGGLDNATALYVVGPDALRKNSTDSYLGLIVSDAFSDLYIPEFALPQLVRATSVPPVARVPLTTKTRQDKKRAPSKPKRKLKRVQARKGRSAREGAEPTQPELEIEVLHRSE